MAKKKRQSEDLRYAVNKKALKQAQARAAEEQARQEKRVENREKSFRMGTAFLYGDYEDYTAFLKLLDEAFAPYERKEFTHTDEGYTPITEPVVTSVPFATEASTNPENGASVLYTFAVNGADEEQVFVLDTLTDLLGADASVLRQQVKDTVSLHIPDKSDTDDDRDVAVFPRIPDHFFRDIRASRDLTEKPIFLKGDIRHNTVYFRLAITHRDPQHGTEGRNIVLRRQRADHTLP